jgi:hypothetical protein
MGKPARLLTDPQLPLAESAFAPAINAVHAAGGKRLRALLNRAIELNNLSLVDISEETGWDEKQIGRSLKDDGGAHPPLSVVACILAKDRLGVVVQGLAAMCGYEAQPKKPDLAVENKRLREKLALLRAEVDRVLEDA